MSDSSVIGSIRMKLSSYLVPDDIIYQGFMCIGRLAKADRDLKCGIDKMFGLLVSALARVSPDQGLSLLDGLMEIMFDTCQHIEWWNGQRRTADMRAVLRCASWISNAFANPAVDEEVVIRWKQHLDHIKLVSLIRMLDSLWSEDSLKRPITDEMAWASIMSIWTYLCMVFTCSFLCDLIPETRSFSLSNAFFYPRHRR